jgi:hypothetical protein
MLITVKKVTVSFWWFLPYIPSALMHAPWFIHPSGFEPMREDHRKRFEPATNAFFVAHSCAQTIDATIGRLQENFRVFRRDICRSYPLNSSYCYSQKWRRTVRTGSSISKPTFSKLAAVLAMDSSCHEVRMVEFCFWAIGEQHIKTLNPVSAK